MIIQKTIENGTVTLAPEGWLDTTSSPELGAQLERIETADAIVFDFARLEYISSAGIRQVVAAQHKAQALGADFSVIHVSAEVMNIFRMTGIDKKIRITE